MSESHVPPMPIRQTDHPPNKAQGNENPQDYAANSEQQKAASGQPNAAVSGISHDGNQASNRLGRDREAHIEQCIASYRRRREWRRLNHSILGSDAYRQGHDCPLR